jgi:hypothetical protein
MRGRGDPQGGLFMYISLEERVPTDRPLRRMKARADEVLGSTSSKFDAM